MRAAMFGLAVLLSLTSQNSAAVLTTEDQIRQAVIGNTVSGVEDGKSYTEYFRPDGYIHGQDLEGPYAGEWRIAGREICTRYFEEDHSISAWECMGVEVNGSHLVWLQNGEHYEAQLVPGNPNEM